MAYGLREMCVLAWCWWTERLCRGCKRKAALWSMCFGALTVVNMEKMKVLGDVVNPLFHALLHIGILILERSSFEF